MIKRSISYLYALVVSQTARSTYLTTFGSGINAFLGFVFTIVVARSISPSDFGLFSVAINLLAVLIVFSDFGLSSSILKFLPQAIREGKKEESKKIIKVSFLISFLICGFLALTLFLFSSPLAGNIFSKKELTLPLMIVSVGLLGLPLSCLFVSILQAQQRFLFAVITDSSLMVIKVLATIILLVLGRLNLISVLIIVSLTSFSGLILGLVFIGPKILFAKVETSLVKTLLGFGIWVALARITNAISGRIDTLMLVRFVETAQVGFYAAAQRMTFIFPVLTAGMTAVLQPKYAALKTIEEAKSFTKKSVLLVGSLFGLIGGIFLIAPWLTILVYGQAYEPAIYIFRWLLLSSSFFVATTIPMIIILYYLGQSKFFTLISALQLALIFLANLVLIPKMGVIGPAISLAFSYGMIFLISSLFVYQKFRQQK